MSTIHVHILDFVHSCVGASEMHHDKGCNDSETETETMTNDHSHGSARQNHHRHQQQQPAATGIPPPAYCLWGFSRHLATGLALGSEEHFLGLPDAQYRISEIRYFLF